MYSSIRIRGFRGLEDFRMEGLGRVNLLVGANNCGKTSILECVQLLSSATPSVLSDIAFRRGEWHALPDREQHPTYALELSHLFADRNMAGEVILAASHCAPQSKARQPACDELRLCVRNSRNEGATGDHHPFADSDLKQGAESRLLQARCSAANDDFDVPLTVDGSMLTCSPLVVSPSHSARFFDGNGMTATDVARLLGDVELTENEELVTCALRTLEPRIERVAAVVCASGVGAVDRPRGPYVREGPAGIFVKLRDVQERMPIGSTGEGMWRMLGLALMLAKAKDGSLLVDEIGAGLHYAVMENMWRLVCEQAAALSVQVFATTHSRDCYESLAAVVKADAAPTEAVTIQRIEQHRKQAVAISGDAIVVAAERGLEVR